MVCACACVCVCTCVCVCGRRCTWHRLGAVICENSCSNCFCFAFKCSIQRTGRYQSNNDGASNSIAGQSADHGIDSSTFGYSSVPDLFHIVRHFPHFLCVVCRAHVLIVCSHDDALSAHEDADGGDVRGQLRQRAEAAPS